MNDYRGDGTISAVLITYNDAERVRPCLESIGWVDEIVVMDLSSTDGTVEICREFTTQIHHHEWLPYADPIRDEVIGLARGTWVLMLDADERVAPPLATALRAIAARDDADVVLVPYWFMSFGRRRIDPLGQSDAIARFFRKGKLHWPSEVHGRPDLTGLRQVNLKYQDGHYILHDSWQTSDELLDKINRYTMEEARLLQSRGTRFTAGALVRETLREVGRGFIYEIYHNGVPGLVSVGFAAFYRFCVWVRLWELQGRSTIDDQRVVRWGGLLGFLPRAIFRAAHRTGRR